MAARATDVAKASAMAKKFDVGLSPVEAYQDYWATPVKTVADSVSLDDKIAFLLRINELGLKQPDVIRIQSQMAFDFEWKYLATSEGSYIEQEIHRASPGFTVTARKNGKVKQRTFSVAPKSAGYEVILDAQDARERRADLRRGGRALHGAAGDGGTEGPGHHAGRTRC